jgi:Zn-dependent protease with chaperone function
MSELILGSEKSPATPTTGQIDVTNLDDKNLGLYRHPNERRALLAIVVGLAAIAVVLWLARPILGNVLDFLPTPILRFLSEWLQPTRLGLVLVGLLALVALMDVFGQSTRSLQLIAQAVEVTPATFPQLAPIVDDLRTRFDLRRSRVYVSRDAPPAGYTIGVREPFAIVFSSIGVGSLTPDEFKFVLGREMGSIKLGHTRMAVVMGNVNMSLPQPFSFLLKFRSVLFGTYHHAQVLSCDRIGVVATRDVGPALSTLIKQNLGTIRGAKIDVKSLAPQTAELNRGISGAVLRASMVLNSQPFAVARLSELVAWAGAPPTPASAAPVAPPPPTPAASATAAAKSAAAAAQSAAEAAASAAAALAAGSSQASDAPSRGTADTGGTSQDATPASPGVTAPSPTSPSPPDETAPATSAITAPAPASEPTGQGTTTPSPAATEGGSVSVTVSRPPHE